MADKSPMPDRERTATGISQRIPQRKVDFEFTRRRLWQITLFHTCVGHPASAVLSRFGLKRLADEVHYYTLPRRVRSKRSRNELAFNHDPRLFWADAFWGVGASICRALGWNELAARLFYQGPVAAVREIGAMDYAPLPREAHSALGVTSSDDELRRRDAR